MLVIVGSVNPIKVAATEAVLARLYGAGVQVRGVDVVSGVSAQPWGDEETQQGALNRALSARESEGAHLGVGLEGGVLEINAQLYTNAWCAVSRDDGVTGLAGGANMCLPPRVAQALRAGGELGVAIDHLTGERNTKHKGGAIGALTCGWLSRQVAYEHILTLAFARLLSDDLWL